MIQALKFHSACKYSTFKTDTLRNKKFKIRCVIVTVMCLLPTLRNESSVKRLEKTMFGYCKEINLRGKENRTHA